MELNPVQKEIVEFERGVLQVVAGPGTGKTEALVSRVVELLKKGFPPDSIVMVTFTRKAAEEFSTRLLEKARGSGVDPLGVYCGTLHSLCLQIMDEFGFDEISGKKLIDDFSRKVFIYDVFKDKFDRFPEFFGRFCWKAPFPIRFVNLVEALVDRIVYYDVDLNSMEKEGGAYREAVDIYRTYEDALKNRGFIDFNTVEKLFLKFLDSPYGKEFLEKVKHLLVDEYQDTNPLDEKIYFKLARIVESFVVVGDEDQSLYSFRGATVKSFIKFESRIKKILERRLEEDFPFKKVFLVKNYRSDRDIINFLNYFIDSFHRLGLERVEGKEKWKLQPADDGDERTERRVSYPASKKLKRIAPKKRPNRVTDLREELAREVSGLIEELLCEGSISKVSDCVLLVPSARENEDSFISFLRKELESKGIKIYNPRSKSFGEKENVKRVVEVLKFVVEGNGELPKTLNREKVEELKEKFRNGKIGLLEVFYALLPLMGYLTDESFQDPELLFDLSQLSNFIKQFELVYPKEEIPEKFGTVFIELIREADEPELPPDYLPDQYLPVMTIHQAKGLEFPVVFVAVDWLYDDDSDAMVEFLRNFVSPQVRGLLPGKDNWNSVRKFFVAFSRAKELLVILDTRENAYEKGVLYPSGNYEDRYKYRKNGGSKLCKKWSPKGRDRGEVEEPRFYSYTGDIVSFELCPRLYALRKFFRFVPSSAVQEWFGTVIHRTLRRIYVFWKVEGRLPDDEELVKIFEQVVKSLEVEGVYPSKEYDKKAALSTVKAFIRKEGTGFYSKVISVELPVKVKKEEYYLKGVIDALLEGENGLEIWDFKSMRNPRRKGRKELLELYRNQLRFYRMIIEESGTDQKVEKLVLYFLNELFEKEPACKEVFTSDSDKTGIEDFWNWISQKIQKIEECRKKRSWPVSENPDENTCKVCDFRFGCPAWRDIIQAT